MNNLDRKAVAILLFGAMALLTLIAIYYAYSPL